MLNEQETQGFIYRKKNQLQQYNFSVETLVTLKFLLKVKSLEWLL